MGRKLQESRAAAPEEIAPGLHWLTVGKGLMRSNVYFVHSLSSWTLIDAGSAGCGSAIREAAEILFGVNTRPRSILLTHDHPDHAGSVRELAGMWRCHVHVHPDEMPLVAADLATIREYANPVDRWLVLPLLRLTGHQRAESIIARGNNKDIISPLDPDTSPAGLPDWEIVPTPGHTPGHVAFFRATDRVLIAGDALLTVDLNSFWGLVRRTHTVSGPPWYTTWDARAAKQSVAELAGLRPRVLAGGHGRPMSGPETAARLQAFSDRS